MVYLKMFILGFYFSFLLFNNLSASLYEENCHTASGFNQTTTLCSDGIAALTYATLEMTGWEDSDIERMRRQEGEFRARLASEKIKLLSNNYNELIKYYWQAEDIKGETFRCENDSIINEGLINDYAYHRRYELGSKQKQKEALEKRRALARELITFQRALNEISKEEDALKATRRGLTYTQSFLSDDKGPIMPADYSEVYRIGGEISEINKDLDRLNIAKFAILNSYPILDSDSWKSKDDNPIFNQPSDSEVTDGDLAYVLSNLLESTLNEIENNILEEAVSTCRQSTSELVGNDFLSKEAIGEHGVFQEIYCREYDKVKGKEIIKKGGLVALSVVAIAAAPLSGGTSTLALGATIAGAGATLADVGIAVNDVDNYYDLKREFLSRVSDSDVSSQALASLEDVKSAKTKAIISSALAGTGAIGESIGIVRTFRAVKWAKSITISEKTWDHLDGVIDVNTKKLKGGMHTEEGLDQFVLTTGHQPIEDITLPNGVRRVKFEREAYTKDAWRSTETASRSGTGATGVKSIFPSSWSREKIAKAVRSVSIPKNKVASYGNGDVMYEGMYDGVRIRTTFTNNELISAYPAWSQPL